MALLRPYQSSEWVVVRLKNIKKKQKYDYIIEVKTGDIYWNNAKWAVAIKCMLIVLVVPFYTGAVMLWYVGKVVVDITRDWSRIQSDFAKIKRAPYYGLKVLCVSCTFPLDIYRTRKWEAMVEYEWHGRVSYRKDFRETYLKELSCLPNLLYGIQNAKVFYLAWCFQKHGNLKDNKYKLVKVLN